MSRKGQRKVNREILFRGKSVNEEKWLYGDYMRYAGGAQIWTHDNDGGTWNAIVDPSTVGQYTALTDKNGVKIFEGDIVRTLETDARGERRSFPVVYKKGAFWLYDKYLLDNNGLDFLAGYSTEKIEVIGNIHDNPELLEGGCAE